MCIKALVSRQLNFWELKCQFEKLVVVFFLGRHSWKSNGKRVKLKALPEESILSICLWNGIYWKWNMTNSKWIKIDGIIQHSIPIEKTTKTDQSRQRWIPLDIPTAILSRTSFCVRQQIQLSFAFALTCVARGDCRGPLANISVSEEKISGITAFFNAQHYKRMRTRHTCEYVRFECYTLADVDVQMTGSNIQHGNVTTKNWESNVSYVLKMSHLPKITS